ncbi:MAG: hypothetical protein DRH56_05090 [Deltaproteobacteria bacterium]|nr:MAG: hypothetical protein DRH56_05090 [Deltaproteobacteria bacterium]
MGRGSIISGSGRDRAEIDAASSSEMKILHIIYDDIHNPWCGGGGALRAAMVNRYLAAENRITVLTGNFPGAKNETIDGVKYVRVGTGSSYLMSRITFTLQIPFFMKRFCSDIVVNDVSFFAPCFAPFYTRRPCVNIVHHLMGRHAFKLYPVLGIVPFINEMIFLKTFRNVVTPSKALREEIVKRHKRIAARNIPNGVADALFDPSPLEEGFVFFLGRIDIYMKGLDILLDAFSGVGRSGVYLKIAGSGKKRDVERLIRLIRDYGLEERVSFLGWVDERRKLDLLKRCLFLVMPSRFEGWGITAVEANAAGKAVVGTNIKGLSEAVVHNRTALLVEAGNSRELSSVMKRLIEDDTLRHRLGREGRTRARVFSWRAIADEQFRFYETVLARG